SPTTRTASASSWPRPCPAERSDLRGRERRAELGHERSDLERFAPERGDQRVDPLDARVQEEVEALAGRGVVPPRLAHRLREHRSEQLAPKEVHGLERGRSLE